MIEVELCNEPAVWDEIVHDLGGHPLQLWGWGEVKSAHGWQAKRLIFTEGGKVVGGAQILVRKLPSVFKNLFYVPRGPFGEAGQESAIISALSNYAKQNLKGVALTIEPDLESADFEPLGWKRSRNHILIARTLILDLSLTEDGLLANMSKKTRQYIRKSQKENLIIKQVTSREELAKCLKIYHQTATRAGFALHNDDYYYDVHEKLGESSVIFASYQGENPVAFVWLAASSNIAFELYGGMDETGQKLRANYALKWHAITKCKEWGIARYDMNGLLNDGISTFKRGFAKHENTLVGSFDLPLNHRCFFWNHGLPLARKILRAGKKLFKH